MTYFLLLLGLLGLFLGGELLVRGAVGIARTFRLSPLVIGLTVVGFGTSMPELLVSVSAAAGGNPGIAMGNVVGSNIANILLILGVAALISPVRMGFADLRRDHAVMLAATVALWLAIFGGLLSRIEGLALVAGLLVFLTLALRSGKDAPAEAGVDAGDVLPPPPLWRAGLITLAGLALLVLGARFLVDSATIIARDFGVSEAVIGLTIVAVGTSLPELATTVVAAFRRQADIAVGNVVGSNVFNILGILGITALIAPIPVDPRFFRLDVPLALAVSAGLVALSWALGRLGRMAGAALLAAYGTYVVTIAAV
ncbi:calcium/sodium antiporter [Frigidibacter oleivorans]|uniref:calcium/sodium antiporter n=1 Tax=Frigidibacter oleivorans TaxID=2487129 RepID=UPI000F8F65CA|nr:calcium/sodium antiporter [Frigidibacter oleivorans]